MTDHDQPGVCQEAASMGRPERPKPRRRIVLTASIEADSWDGLYGHLRSLTTQMATQDMRLGNSVSGGYSAGHIIEVSEDVSIDHSSWIAELNAYLDERDALGVDPKGKPQGNSGTNT